QVPEGEDDDGSAHNTEYQPAVHGVPPLRNWLARLDRAVCVSWAVDWKTTTTFSAKPCLDELGTQSPVNSVRSPRRSSHRAVDVWSKPLAWKVTVPSVPVVPPAAGVVLVATVFWPWNPVSQTSLGITVATSVSILGQETSSCSTPVTWAWRWASSVWSTATLRRRACSACSWAVRASACWALSFSLWTLLCWLAQRRPSNPAKTATPTTAPTAWRRCS